MNRTGKFTFERHLKSRFRHFAESLLSEETVHSMEKREYQRKCTEKPEEVSDAEIKRLLEKYDPPVTIVTKDTLPKEPIDNKKTVKFQKSVYACAKQWAKEDGVSIGEYINKAVDNLNLANQMLKDMSKELDTERNNK